MCNCLSDRGARDWETGQERTDSYTIGRLKYYQGVRLVPYQLLAYSGLRRTEPFCVLVAITIRLNMEREEGRKRSEYWKTLLGLKQAKILSGTITVNMTTACLSRGWTECVAGNAHRTLQGFPVGLAWWISLGRNSPHYFEVVGVFL